jgi:nucleoside-diphosphate-sugar epimerase
MTLTHAHASPVDPKRVVILGSTGFLGAGILAACATAGIAAVGFSSRDLDLTAADAGARLAQELKRDDVLLFLSALTPDKGRDSATLMRNLAMGRAVATATRAVAIAQLVYASSDAVYPFGAGLVCEESLAAPADLYGAMHRTRELLLAAEAKAPLAVLRYTAVYGAADTHNAYGPNRFLRQALKEGRIALFGNGEETRDHLAIDDAGALTLAVIRRGSTGLINLVSGKSLSFRAVAEMVAQAVGRAVTIEPSERKNPITHRHFDNTELLRAFPDARFTPFDKGLAAMHAAMALASR